MYIKKIQNEYNISGGDFISTLEIDLFAMAKNILDIKKNLKANQKICLVVKADAYGFGSEKICKTLNNFVDFYAISSKNEFFQIKNLVTKPILLLVPDYLNTTKLARSGCEICVSNRFQFDLIEKESESNSDVSYIIHIAVNTGMNRYGFCEIDEILSIFKKVQNSKNIIIKGIFSHYFDANNKYFAIQQKNKLENIRNLLFLNNYGKDVIFHISNSDGIKYDDNFDMVRCGMLVYDDAKYPTLTLKSKILEIQTLNKGDTAGYSRIFVANHKMKIAVVGIGYADGIFRSIAGRGYVLINAKFCKILAVCMDSIIVDVSGVNAHLFDDVILIGKSGPKQIFICDVASWCDTIGYEIICRLSRRIKRKYKSGELCRLLQENIVQENSLVSTRLEQDQHLQE